MQATTDTTPAGITLHGEWTMDEAANRLECLTGELARQLEIAPRPDRTDIDFAEVTDLDACGCQLLALFFEKLKGHGITPDPGGISPLLRDTICLLGFSDALTGYGTQEKESE